MPVKSPARGAQSFEVHPKNWTHNFWGALQEWIYFCRGSATLHPYLTPVSSTSLKVSPLCKSAMKVIVSSCL